MIVKRTREILSCRCDCRLTITELNPINYSDNISPDENLLWDGENFSAPPEDKKKTKKEFNSGKMGFARETLIREASWVNQAVAVDHPFPWDDLAPPPVPVLRTSVKKYTMAIDVLPIVRVRISEGEFPHSCRRPIFKIFYIISSNVLFFDDKNFKSITCYR